MDIFDLYCAPFFEKLLFLGIENSIKLNEITQK